MASPVLALEAELDGFHLITPSDLVGHSESSPPYLDAIRAHVDDLAAALWPVNKTIHDNPELCYEEVIAHATLTKFLAARPGWTVTPSAYGIATAFVAVWDSGRRGPVVSFNAEYDALTGIGHACGHNLIATASLAGALATAAMMKEHALGGKIVLFGTPAEEGGGGKIALLRAGAYAAHRVDLNLISHPGIAPDSALCRTTAYARFQVEYVGREAHAAASPWLGINALDALVVAYNSLSVLRQQTMPGDVIQGHITSGGAAPNIIHAYAAGVFVVRANTQARLKVLREKVDRCFTAAAEATGATLTVTEQGAYKDHVPNRALGRSFTKYFNLLSPPNLIPEDQDVDEIRGATMASSDQGDVSYAMPSLSPNFSIPPGKDGNGPHNPGFAQAAGTRVAFERALRVGTGLAGVAVDVLTTEGLLEEVRSEWRRAMAEAKGR